MLVFKNSVECRRHIHLFIYTNTIVVTVADFMVVRFKKMTTYLPVRYAVLNSIKLMCALLEPRNKNRL